MQTRSKTIHYFLYVLLATFAAGLMTPTRAQAPAQLQNYPNHLPYSFSNLVWWNDEELRNLLKKRIPGLEDEIAPKPAAEGRIREALKTLLKEKGVSAELQSIEPSDFTLTGERAPGVPQPSIVFTVLSPQILVDKVSISHAPDETKSALNQNLSRREGHPYSSGQDWLITSNVKDELVPKGYLDAQVEIEHDAPRHEGDHYVVNLLISIRSGSQYHISSIAADGGPLLQGRDLSSLFSQKPGDVAGVGPFGRLAGELRSYYERFGYADVAIQDHPIMDREHALVSYHLDVTPGQIYYLRTLSVHNLNGEQESKVRELLGMKPGDVFNETAISSLYHKIPSEPTLGAYGFTFGPKKDKAAAQVDLTLDFYKTGGTSSVTIK